MLSMLYDIKPLFDSVVGLVAKGGIPKSIYFANFID